jgi:eukaryotic-like serine/threonine-protein kinase
MMIPFTTIMDVTTGTRLGPYEILSRLGAGGMGEVWSARDTRLERRVAVKILPAEFAQSAQFKLRFEREAKTISQLSHPNICTLYDVGVDYLVMELLEGESLAERLDKGPLPIADVFRYGAQIADALEKAHRAGVIHRDLKPGNVMIPKSGATLLDFGLSKPTAEAVNVGDATAHRPLTEEGTILGTFQYMAPEQLEGLEADARTDIFAFGALLYEMATGKRAFQGKTRTSLIAAIIGGSPRPLAELRPATPSDLEHIIAKCLEKEPDERWQSVHDIGQELRWTAERESRAAVEVRPKSRTLPAAAAITSWLLLAGAAVWYFTRPELPTTVTSLVAPPGHSFNTERSSVVISPDGRRVAFVAESGTSSALFVRDLGGTTARALTGTEEAGFAFWSPDSNSLGFIAGGKLKTISVDGGPPQTIADAPSSRGGTWSGDTIVFNANFREGLSSVSSDGGTVTKVSQLASGEISHRWPAFLPDGEHVLFLCQRAEGGSQGDQSTIDVISLKSGKRKPLVRTNSSPLYAPPSYLLFWREKALLAQKFDVGSLEVSGSSLVVAEDVSYTGTEAVIASASLNGTLVYQTAGDAGKVVLTTADRNGNQTRIEAMGPPQFITDAVLSRDGKRLAFSILDQGDDLGIIDLARETTSRLTFDGGDETAPVWSPDGSRIAFSSNRSDGGDVYLIGTGGADVEQPLFISPEAATPSDWSSDGLWLLLSVDDPKTGFDIWSYSFETKSASPLIRTPFHENEAVFSPDGQFIAFTSTQSGRPEVYVQNREGKGPRWQASKGGGSQPVWRSDGRELFFIGPDQQLFAAAISQSGEFGVEPPVALFGFRASGNLQTRRSYSPFPDGQRFVIRAGSANSDAPVTIVQRWTGLLRK